MRKLIYIIFWIYFCNNAVSQVNLIYNPSFEFTVVCPSNVSQIANSTGWSPIAGSTDYFNSCTGNSFVSVPFNLGGYQVPATGNAYAGMVTFYPSVANYRESFGTILTSSLTINTKYFFSVKVCLSYSPTFYGLTLAANNIGIKLFNGFPGYVPPANNPKLNFNTIVTDTVNWTFLSGSFIADSAYNYLAIGNFFTDINTSSVSLGPAGNPASYYYIDDLCLSTDSLLCNSIVTGNNNLEANGFITVHPQPASDFANIKLNYYFEKTIEAIITDVTGKEIEKKELEVSHGKTQFSTLHLANGIYILQLKNSQGQVAVKRLVVSR